MMFRKRKNSQKPLESFYDSFKDAYPRARIARSSPLTSSRRTSFVQSLTDDLSDGLVDDSLEDFRKDLPDTPYDEKRSLSRTFTDIQDPNQTPQMSHEPWIFTPSGLNSNSFETLTPSDQLSEFHKPTVRWASTLYETVTGYPYIPELVTEVETGQEMPHSLFGSDYTTSVGWIENTHSWPSQPKLFEQSQSFAESVFLHQPSDFKYISGPENGTLVVDRRNVAEMQPSSPIMSFPPNLDKTGISSFDPAFLKSVPSRFRFCVKLNAPTAMMAANNEIPVTYLNKGQIYLMSINDTRPAVLESTPIRYRTSIRISFEDEDQGKGQSLRWQLWKNGRGAKEADHRGVQLQGIEYVEVQQAINYEGKVELETSTIDGFSVLWSQELGGAADCHVAVRFNFLSTDFSYAKGVRGISCRLCAKTVIVSSQSPQNTQEIPDISYCQVKLFRDHGAERKHANDIVHVNRSISKIRQQISKIEFDIESSEKRKQRASTTGARAQRGHPSEFPGHKSPWPFPLKSSAEEDLHLKLSTTQIMLLSAQPVSILNVRGREQDDPDRQPILFVDEHLGIAQVKPEEIVNLQRRANSNTTSVHSKEENLVIDQKNRVHSMSPTSIAQVQPSNPQYLASPPTENMEIEIANYNDIKTLHKQAETLQDDSSSKCTALPRQLNPALVACFYTLYPNSRSSSTTPKKLDPPPSQNNHYYQAIYLCERTADALATSIAGKYDFFRPSRSIVRMTHVSATKPGIEITVDDDFVRELREGQDMLLEWEGQGGGSGGGGDEGYVLRLMF